MVKRIDLAGKKFGDLEIIEYVGDKKWKCKCKCGEYCITYSNSLRRGGKSHCGCKGIKFPDRFKDLKGQKFHMLTVLRKDENLMKKRAFWVCACDCGNETIVRGSHLLSGQIKGCGCIAAPDLTGKRYGRLVVIEDTGKRTAAGRTKFWKCKCDCGNFHTTTTDSLNRGFSTSCGCHLKEKILNIDVVGLNTVYSYLKTSARHRKIKFSLSKEIVKELINSNCYYCDSRPDNKKMLHPLNGEKQRRYFTYQGIDRLNSERGYFQGNVVPCCHICNRMKTDMTEENFINHIKLVLNERI